MNPLDEYAPGVGARRHGRRVGNRDFYLVRLSMLCTATRFQPLLLWMAPLNGQAGPGLAGSASGADECGFFGKPDTKLVFAPDSHHGVHLPELRSRKSVSVPVSGSLTAQPRMWGAPPVTRLKSGGSPWRSRSLGLAAGGP